ncbi:MAG TPA: AmmeMemoRadiSam system radical SAM enzyme [Bacteroidales bacterium]|nr:AmmeMemoRadiSam system radical SAM enzyme [Bacteroidales bacterium]
MQKAKYYVQENEDKVRCLLCPHHCLLKSGQTGICKVRTHRGDMLVSDNYGLISAKHMDPIEKKPLYHYFPGSKIFSIGSVGCNMQCFFCQNCEISQTGVTDFPWLKAYSPEEMVSEALLVPGNIGIAYTYNEPSVFYEYMFDSATLSKSKGLKNVMVSNGYIEKEPLNDLIPLVDAFNIDLKAFTEEFYMKCTHSHLEPVKQTLLHIREAGKHLEINNLVIPGLNDSEEIFETMVDWIAVNLGRQTILHLSRYFPRHLATHPTTLESTLYRFKDIASQYIDFVYIGNVGGETDTNCPNCKSLVIKRKNYETIVVGLDNQGCCINCRLKIAIC